MRVPSIWLLKLTSPSPADHGKRRPSPQIPATSSVPNGGRLGYTHQKPGVERDRMSPSKRIISRPGMITTGFYMVCMVVALSMWGLSSYINGLQYVLAPSDDPAALSKAQDAYAAIERKSTRLSSS